MAYKYKRSTGLKKIYMDHLFVHLVFFKAKTYVYLIMPIEEFIDKAKVNYWEARGYIYALPVKRWR